MLTDEELNDLMDTFTDGPDDTLGPFAVASLFDHIKAQAARIAALEAALVKIGAVDWPAGHCLDGALEMRRIAGLALAGVRAALEARP